ncbi:MAG: Bacterioferritin-associated ferredoxin [Candidatus Celerinatantimonas neptuna]|nr:MAG: Bacterioferritin-associated ferredoxin [Candidatus Celerinatantimonas neptuna]
MFVCLCQGITDTQIRQAVRQGQVTFSQIKRELNVAMQCGRCRKMTQHIINQEIEAQADYYEAAS